jgi:integrase/recombinase XerD
MSGAPPRVTKEYLEPEETKLFEKAATCLRDQLLFRILRVLGCRITEALSLREEDFDFQRRQVTIVHLKASANLSCPFCVEKGVKPADARLSRKTKFCPHCGKAVNKAIRKKQEYRKQRSLPIDVTTLGMIRNYLDQGGGLPKGSSLFLFGISRQRAWQIFREYSTKLGLPDLVNSSTGVVRHISPHKFRDAFAIQAMKMDSSGDGQRLLQEHLGHAKFDTTARYRKLAGEEREDWFNKLMGEGGKKGVGK